jgi:ribosomal protein S18 acetylase RimI-like enzyme
MVISHRPMTTADEVFVRQIIAEVLIEDLGAQAWPAEVRAPLVELQYRARQEGILSNYPEAVQEILTADGVTVGWLAVAKCDAEFRLIDIAVSAAFRGKGIGSARLRELTEEAEAAGTPLRLNVFAGNPAIRLYQRLGFQRIRDDGFGVLMERPALMHRSAKL